MKKIMTLTLAIAAVFAARASQSTFTVTTPQGRSVTVMAVTDNIIKVENTAPGQTPPPSRATVLQSSRVNADVAALQAPLVVLSTGSGIVVTGDTRTGDIVINAGADKVITDDGSRTLTDGRQALTLLTTSRGSYYGAGERGHKLNLRGDTLTMYNRQNYGYTKGDARINQMNITMPLFLSSDGFALVFDDYAAAQLVLSDGPEIEYITESQAPVSYYFVNGVSTLADVTEALSGLTGRQPLPPLWSLGYITSKYGYHDERETLGAIDSLKERHYPVDGIVLDLYWYGKEQDMGRLAWDPEQWPDPEGMLKKLKDENVNLVAISQPYILRNGKGVDNYNYLSAEGMLVADSTGLNPQEVVIWVGEGGMFDVSNPKTRQWMANRYKQLTDMGVTGWWGDLGEPEVHPETGLHSNGLNARLYHNQYGNDWSEIIYDMFRKEYPDRRLLTMMRGGTTGLQRYSVFPWSTDVSRSWGGLQPQITIMLNSGLSGLGYMGHDVGGFAVDPANPVDPELYVRWLQLGLFSPMLRTHAQHNAEPYHYPEYADLTLSLIRERYRWLPYNYTLAYENARYGYPLVRPLNFYDKANTAFDSIDDEYLWGSEVLVAPVMQQGATSREITFPNGEWIDYYNPSKAYKGNTTATCDAPLQVLPLFVRAGAFIPQADYKMESTADYNPANITVKYYPRVGVSSSFTMYDDDRVSPRAIEDNAYRLITFSGVASHEDTEIEVTSTGSYTGAPDRINITFEVMDIDKAPKSVIVNGKKVKARYDKAGSTLRVALKFVPGEKTTIKINQ